ncbi:MAG: DUF3280 domain-containing protein [Acetobacteraceae bacterium]|nr:DUF3280 domain-containing protein [Acetobacteraceae bacterium]
MRLIGGLLLAGLIAGSAAAATPPTVAVFPLELYDTSGEGPSPDQERRLRMLDAELLARLAESARYAPVAAQLPEGAPGIRNCNRCDIKAAARLGAPLALSGVVHKISSLILTLTLVLREVPSGETRHVWRADFRGNTDESWQHALNWMLRHRVLAAPEHVP